MNIIFRKLSPETAGDFFRFFDHDAFSDHPEWDGCYCLESHIPPDEDARLEGHKPQRRERARELIESGVLTGYLIYDGERVIGWCNVGDKATFRPICENPDYVGPDGPGRVLVLYCLDIAPGYRGQGIAGRTVERVLADAAAEGYAWAEVYPYVDEDFPFPYKGTRRMYERFGFETVRQGKECYVMRKKL